MGLRVLAEIQKETWKKLDDDELAKAKRKRRKIIRSMIPSRYQISQKIGKRFGTYEAYQDLIAHGLLMKIDDEDRYLLTTSGIRFLITQDDLRGGRLGLDREFKVFNRPLGSHEHPILRVHPCPICKRRDYAQSIKGHLMIFHGMTEQQAERQFDSLREDLVKDLKDHPITMEEAARSISWAKKKSPVR